MRPVMYFKSYKVLSKKKVNFKRWIAQYYLYKFKKYPKYFLRIHQSFIDRTYITYMEMDI